MIGILFGAWLFCLIGFCALGVGCRVACHRRRLSGRACICGRHETDRGSWLRQGPGDTRGRIDGRPSRLRAAEASVRALQQRYVEGRLSMEQYETELDRVVGLA